MISEELIPAGHPEWDAYVAAHENATLYNLSGWGHIAARAYDIAPYLLVSRERIGAPIRGGLPLFVVPRPLNHYVTSGLFGAYGPMLAESAETRAELSEAARRFADAHRAEFLHLKSLDGDPTPEGFMRHDIWVTAKLPLDGGAEAVWGRFKTSIRAAIRQAQKAELEVRWGQENLDAFYDVLADNMHRKGSPIYGRPFMREMLQAFGDAADVLTLWKDGEPISGAMTATFNDVMYVPFASSRAAYFPLRPNNLLYWKIIERGCERGLHTLDYGTSMRGSSTLDFKLHWGARLHPLPSYVYTRAAEQPTLAPGPGSRAVSAGVWLFKTMPRPMADSIGPVVSRFIV